MTQFQVIATGWWNTMPTKEDCAIADNLRWCKGWQYRCKLIIERKEGRCDMFRSTGMNIWRAVWIWICERLPVDWNKLSCKHNRYHEVKQLGIAAMGSKKFKCEQCGYELIIELANSEIKAIDPKAYRRWKRGNK